MDNTDRISTIGSSILAQAEKESRALVDKANAIREREIAAAEEQMTLEAGERLQRLSSDIRREYAASVASAHTHAREELLRRRDELLRTVFMNVQASLTEFAGSPDYQASLLGEIGEVKAAWDHAASIVSVSERDLAFAAAIKQLLPGVQVEPDENIRLGGWKLRNTKARIMIDQSYETRLRDQKEWFLEHCNLEVT